MTKKRYNLRFLLIISFLALGTSALFAGNSQNPEVRIQVDSIAQKDSVSYEVFGMDCPGCQSALEKQLKKIDGVADAKASFKEKQVVIELKPDAKVSDEEIEKRIKKANFTPGKKIEPAKNEK
ncbi:MAG: cation transporter [Mariniphaga sp.]|nr:cation transporter [Mariniphaga sp.]